MPSVIDRYPDVRPSSRSEWRTWLRRHHATSPGVWVIYSKLSAGRRPLSYDAAVEEALCFGWIDSLVRSIDERSYRQLFTPRKPRSTWSALNKRRVTALVRSGHMTEAGMVKIRAAKKDGSWSALGRVDRLVPPADLAKVLRTNSAVRKGYEGWNASVRRAVLWWLQTAKRPATRAARFREIVDSAARGVKPRPMRTTA